MSAAVSAYDEKMYDDEKTYVLVFIWWTPDVLPRVMLNLIYTVIRVFVGLTRLLCCRIDPGSLKKIQ